MPNFNKAASLAVGASAAATLIVSGAPARAVSITPTNDGNTLANTILGSGITINSVTYTGAADASGTFIDGLSSGIGIDEGIILTTGDAASAEGPNSADDTTTIHDTAGDADLDALIPQSTNDAAVLEINFTTDTGDIFFNYVFASEEYNEFANSEFNDVFAFFLNGSNIALVPGTSDPVAINTVNGGNPLGTDASNPQFYNNNDLNDGGPFFNLEYDGFTDVFSASFLGLEAGVENTLKLAIADAGDSILDSAVFIEGSSFSSVDPEPIPEPLTLLGTGAALGFGVILRRSKYKQRR